MKNVENFLATTFNKGIKVTVQIPLPQDERGSKFVNFFRGLSKKSRHIIEILRRNLLYNCKIVSNFSPTHYILTTQSTLSISNLQGIREFVVDRESLR